MQCFILPEMWGILNFVSILGFVHFGEKTSRFENVCKQLKKYLQKKQHLQVHLKKFEYGEYVL